MASAGIWTNKPPPGTLLNWSHPYTQGLVAAWVFNEAPGLPYELVQFRPPSASTAFGWSSNANGTIGLFNGSTTNLTYSQVPAIGPGMSLAGACTLNATSFTLIERSPVNSTWLVIGSGTTLAWRGNSGGANDRCDLSIAGLIGTGKRFSWAFSDTGISSTISTANVNGYINGALAANSAVLSNIAVSNTNAIHIGNFDGSGFFLNGTQDYIYLWNYAISAQQAADIANNPYQIFSTRARSPLFKPSTVVAMPAMAWCSQP